MKETVIYRAEIITRTEILLLRTSEERELIISFIEDEIPKYIEDNYFKLSDFEIMKGEDTYTLVHRKSKNFLCCFMCSQIIHILDREEEEETEETAEN